MKSSLLKAVSLISAAWILFPCGISAAASSGPRGGYYLENYFECRESATREFETGECEARARHELALAVEPFDFSRAARLHESAISFSPSFLPAYFALAKLALDYGKGSEELFLKLKGLLSRAPKRPELLRLKARLDGWGRGR